MTRAMLLCAGYGTRLGALSDERPKPMLPVCNIPILHFGIALLVGHGIRDIVINLHYKGGIIEREIGDGSALGARVQYIHEPGILGTGGGLKNALHLLDPEGTDEPFLSLNGKLIFDVDLRALLAAHAAAPEALGTMVVRKVPDAQDWGAVDVDTSGPIPRIRNILGAGGYMFCGVHVTRPSVMRRLPDGEACSIRQGYLPWLQNGELVAAFEAPDGYFAEHSTPRRYVQSTFDLLDGVRLRHPPGPLSGVDASANVHPSAVIQPPVCIAAGVEIGAGAVVGPYVALGQGSMVEAGASVERTVAWPDSRVRGIVRNSIVTPAGVVPAS